MAELNEPRQEVRLAAAPHHFPLKQQLLDLSHETELASEVDYAVQRYDHVALQPGEQSTLAASSSRFDHPKTLSSHRIHRKLVALEQQEFNVPKHELEAIAQADRTNAASTLNLAPTERIFHDLIPLDDDMPKESDITSRGTKKRASRRHVHPHDAVLERLYDASMLPSPWFPKSDPLPSKAVEPLWQPDLLEHARRFRRHRF
eukprot:m.15243 g.15243  ORF g.15243 m.15243 type:complete len:203 (+) comp10437_c0_seq1:64-672(+)